MTVEHDVLTSLAINNNITDLLALKVKEKWVFRLLVNLFEVKAHFVGALIACFQVVSQPE